MAVCFQAWAGFEQGLEQAGFEIAWQVEIDKDAVSVLERHYPDVPRYGDIRDVDPADLAPVDVVTGGFPCQDLSVAGKRAGLIGSRSGLFWEAVRIVGEMREATDGRYPAFVVLENVPGLLSAGISRSNPGGDFALVLAGLQELGAAVAWRILDARFFGVPQRRRRVFIVADFAEPDTGERRVAEVLSLTTRGDGHPAPGREAGQAVARDAENGAGGFSESGPGWWRDGIGYTIHEAHAHDCACPPIEEWDTDPYAPPVAAPLTAGGHPNGTAPGRCREDDENLVAVGIQLAQTGANGSNLSDNQSPTLDSTGRQAVAFHLTQDPINGAESPALGAGNGKGCSTVGVATWDERNVTSKTNRTRVEFGAPANTLHADGLSIIEAVAVTENMRAEVRETPYANALAVGGGKPGQGYPSVRQGMAVRRLTPTECCRLMGWPDSWVRFRADGSVIPDGVQYRLIGNGVVAPVARWIGERLRRVLEQPS